MQQLTHFHHTLTHTGPKANYLCSQFSTLYLFLTHSKYGFTVLRILNPSLMSQTHFEKYTILLCAAFLKSQMLPTLLTGRFNNLCFILWIHKITHTAWLIFLRPPAQPHCHGSSGTAVARGTLSKQQGYQSLAHTWLNQMLYSCQLQQWWICKSEVQVKINKNHLAPRQGI